MESICLFSNVSAFKPWKQLWNRLLFSLKNLTNQKLSKKQFLRLFPERIFNLKFSCNGFCHQSLFESWNNFIIHTFQLCLSFLWEFKGKHLLNPRPTEDTIKSQLSVSLSVSLSVHQFGIFLRNELSVLSDILHSSRWLECLKSNWAVFPGKFFFVQIWAKRAHIGFKMGFLWNFWKILSLVVPRSNLKWKLVLLLILHH